MTSDRLAAILADLEPLGLSYRRLAALWRYRSDNSVRQMLDGRTAVPDDRAAWLEGLHAWWVANRIG